MKAFLLLTAASVIGLAAPATAQSMDHSNMPGMKMPAKPAPKPKPAAKPRPAAKPTAKPAPRRAPAPAKPAAAQVAPAADPDCPPEHAEKGHCTPTAAAPPAPAQTDPHAGHDMSAMPDLAKPDASTSEATASHGTGGTALPAGDASAPAAPEPSYADRVWGREAMVGARNTLRREHGGGSFSQVMLDIAELQIRQGREGYRWEGEGWFGGDIDRLVVKTEGEGTFNEAVDDAEAQALYSRTIGPYFNLQGGVRHDFEPKARTYAAFGIEGLAPYWFEVEAHAFVSTKGDVLGRLAANYDQRITQRLILQPRVELNLAAQDVHESGIGSGLSDAELDLRLRYEIAREFAPYIGISYSAKIGRTADFARAAGEDASSTGLVLGVRAWF